MQMNWRLLTAINAAIALVTVCAVIYMVTRSPAPKRTSRESAQRRSEPSTSSPPDERAGKKISIESPEDLTNARVDDLGAVPAVELTELMRRATPEQLAILADKFNDAPTDARTLGGMAIFFQNWAQLDPQSALINAFKLNDVTFRKLATTAVVGSASPSAAAELIGYITQHPDKDLSEECKNRFLNPLIDNWSTLDPEAASKYLDELGDTKNELNSTARENIAYNWASLDPSAALDWIAKQKGKDFVGIASLHDAALRGWCLKDLAAAATYVQQHLDEPVGKHSVESVAKALFDHSIEDATRWIGRLPAGEQRGHAETAIAQSWVDKDPVASSKWLATLSESDQKDLVETIVRGWAAQNWTDTSRWIETLTGDVRDYAISSAMNMHPEGTTESDSLTMALTIRNEELRTTRIYEAIQGWAYSDAQSAETWVRNSPLSSEEKEHLLSRISEIRKTTSEEAAAEATTN